MGFRGGYPGLFIYVPAVVMKNSFLSVLTLEAKPKKKGGKAKGKSSGSSGG